MYEHAHFMFYRADRIGPKPTVRKAIRPVQRSRASAHRREHAGGVDVHATAAGAVTEQLRIARQFPKAAIRSMEVPVAHHVGQDREEQSRPERGGPFLWP